MDDTFAPLQNFTATSFAVLGLLALREWTTYELAQQMKRSFSYFWPRAERRIYDEPGRLAAAGYVQARREVVGRRPRTCWQITPAGRDALRDWLGEPGGAGPEVEFEGMVKVFLSEHAGKQQLLRTLATIRADARARVAALEAMCAEVTDSGGGLFPQRAHLNALVMDYVLGVAELTDAWAQRSEQIVRGWRSASSPGSGPRGDALEFFADHATS